MLANLQHAVALITGRLKGVDYTGRAVDFKDMLGQAPHRFLIMLFCDARHLKGSGAAEVLGPHPAVTKCNFFLVGPLAGISVGERKSSRDGPFAGFRGYRRDVGFGEVEENNSNKFHTITECSQIVKL